VYAAERFVKESGERLSPTDRSSIETAAESLRKAIEANDSAAIARGMEELTQAQHKAAANLYQQAGAGAAGERPSGGGAGAADGGAGRAPGAGAAP
jgi:molecular chaperone DnaK